MKKRQNGWVYVLRESGVCDGPVKIGFANDVFQRIKQLQAGNPRRLELVIAVRGNTEVEAMAHRCHRLDRIRFDGEWFDCSEDIEKFIESLRRYEKSGEVPFGEVPKTIDEEVLCWTDPVWIQQRSIAHMTARRPGYRSRLRMPDRVAIEIVRRAGAGDEACAAVLDRALGEVRR